MKPHKYTNYSLLEIRGYVVSKALSLQSSKKIPLKDTIIAGIIRTDLEIDPDTKLGRYVKYIVQNSKEILERSKNKFGFQVGFAHAGSFDYSILNISEALMSHIHTPLGISYSIFKNQETILEVGKRYKLFGENDVYDDSFRNEYHILVLGHVEKTVLGKKILMAKFELIETKEISYISAYANRREVKLQSQYVYV